MLAFRCPVSVQFLFSTLFLAVSINGAGAVPAPDDALSTQIEGVVVTEDGTPMGGTTVHVHDRNPLTVRSRVDGSFTISLQKPALRYTTLVAATADGALQGILRFDDQADQARVAGARIVVKPCRTATVNVTDTTGLPVPGALLHVFDICDPVATAETNAAGIGVVRYPADARVWWFTAMKPAAGFDYFENDLAANSEKPPPLPQTIKLRFAGTQTVRLRATDSAGQPMDGIDFSVWTFRRKDKRSAVNVGGCPLIGCFAARTDVQGIAAFDWIPNDVQSATFVCRSPDLSTSGIGVTFDSRRPENPLPAVLNRHIEASGKVTLPDGKPAAGILVQAEGLGRFLARTNAEGVYRLSLPPKHTYLIGVTDGAWAAKSLDGVTFERDRPLRNLDFQLGQGTLIEGTLTIGANRAAFAQQTITIVQQPHIFPPRQGGFCRLVRWAKTDDDGYYRIRIGPGNYELMAPGGAKTFLRIQQEEKVEQNFHVVRMPRAVLQGLVVDGQGKSIAGAHVRGAGFEITADGDGKFALERQTTQMRLHARNGDGTLASFTSLGEDDAYIKIVLVPAGQIKGTVVGKNGKPSPGLQLLCFCESVNAPVPLKIFSFQQVAETDARGRFVFTGLVVGHSYTVGLADGRHTVRIENPTAKDLGALVYEPTDDKKLERSYGLSCIVRTSPVAKSHMRIA
jgi:hypothetical protein